MLTERSWVLAALLLTLSSAFFYPPSARGDDAAPPALQVYMGRRIARTMHFTGAEWLIRDEREREERCSLMQGVEW